MKSDVALLLSVAALLVSFAALYFNKLQPGRPVGGISYAMIWRFSNLPDSTETDFTFSPVLPAFPKKPSLVQASSASMVG